MEIAKATDSDGNTVNCNRFLYFYFFPMHNLLYNDVCYRALNIKYRPFSFHLCVSSYDLFCSKHSIFQNIKANCGKYWEKPCYSNEHIPYSKSSICHSEMNTSAWLRAVWLDRMDQQRNKANIVDICWTLNSTTQNVVVSTMQWINTSCVLCCTCIIQA